MKDFIQSVTRIASPLDLSTPTVDINPILKYLQRTVNDKLSLLELTRKLAWLFAITTYSRASDLARMPMTEISIHDNTIQGKVMELKETRSGRKIIKPFSIKSHPDTNLCPVQCFVEYSWRTRDIRSEDSMLFITTRKPYVSATSTSLARWISDMFHIADPNISSRAARSTGSSISIARGLDIDTVTTVGNWASQNTFDTHYRHHRTAQVNVSQIVLSWGLIWSIICVTEMCGICILLE
jgi:hypothetical protein